jgi:hypothetical protein
MKDESCQQRQRHQWGPHTIQSLTYCQSWSQLRLPTACHWLAPSGGLSNLDALIFVLSAPWCLPIWLCLGKDICIRYSKCLDIWRSITTRRWSMTQAILYPFVDESSFKLRDRTCSEFGHLQGNKELPPNICPNREDLASPQGRRLMPTMLLTPSREGPERVSWST